VKAYGAPAVTDVTIPAFSRTVRVDYRGEVDWAGIVKLPYLDFPCRTKAEAKALATQIRRLLYEGRAAAE
jgi:hypothetical protein